MESVRYYLALLLLMAIPGSLLFWFSVHPFIEFWRKLGPAVTYAIHFTLMGIVAAGIFLVRELLLQVQFGTSPILITLALPIYVLANVVALRRRKRLAVRVMMGLPEIAPTRHKRPLVTEGIYSRIRHPRYVEILLCLLAYSLFANYLAVYIMVGLASAAIALIVRLEEKELRMRFGEEYERYCERVPRFIPKS